METVTFIKPDGSATILICEEGETPAERIARRQEEIAQNKEAQGHDCWENAVQYEGDGPLGHGWKCGVCGKLLQVG